MAVKYTLVGAVTDTSATIAVVLDAAADVRVAVSEFPDMSSPSYGATVSSASLLGEHRAKLATPTLTERTRYFYQVDIVTGGVGLSGDIGQFWTTWEDGKAGGYTFVHTSCTETISSDATDPPATVTTGVHLAAQTGMLIDLGDLHYRDSTSTDATTRASYLDAQMVPTYGGAPGTPSRLNRLFRQQANDYMFDDHDFGDNDSSASPTAAAAQASWDGVFPHYPLPALAETPVASTNKGAWHSFTVGRIFVIVTDLRTNRSPNADADGPSKTMMGADQKQWFKDQLDAARDGGYVLVVWMDTQVWNSDGTDPVDGLGSNKDCWWAFDNERTELANYMNDLSGGSRPKVIELSGDMHAVARRRDAFWGDDDNGQYVDCFNTASLFAAAGGARGSVWDVTPYLANQVYGRLCVRDGPEGIWIYWDTIDDPLLGTSATKFPIDYQVDAPTELTEPTVTYANANALPLQAVPT